MLFGAYGGLISDRIDRRRLMILTQSLLTVVISAFAVLWLQLPSLALVYGVVLVQGLANALDNPLRRSFVRDLASDAELTSAISLMSTVQTVSRTVGPALAGLTISMAGPEWCFILNALSYGAVLASLALIDPSKMRERSPMARGPGQLRAGFRYAWQSPGLRRTLMLMAIVGVFGWNWSALLPVYAVRVFSGDATLYGMLVALLSVGSILGGLTMARTLTVGLRHLIFAGTALAVALIATAAAPGLGIAIVGLFFLGAAGTAFTIGAQTRVQVLADDAFQGRTVALFSMALAGSKPIGGLIGGWIIDVAGPREAFGAGGVVVAVAIGTILLVRAVQDRRHAAITAH